MLQDPMSLLSAYMQGSRFAQDNIDRARARENKDTKRMVDAGMGVLLSHTTRVNPQTGQVELRPEAEIWKDPQFLRDFSDTAFGQQVLREGMTDEQKKSVDKIVPVRATQISANKAGAPEYGIEVEWRDKEGKPISRGPIAVDANGQRSASDDAMVVPIKTSDVFHTALSKAYQYNPDWAKQYQATLLNASKQSLVNQWMRDPDNRAAIEQQYALAGGDPSEFSKLTKYDLEKRPYTVQDPSGVTKTVNPDRTTTITYDPEVAKVGDQVAAKETENLVKRESSLSEGRLTFDEANNDRQLKLDADKITNQYETQLRNKLTHSEDELKLEAARIANNYVTNLGLDKQYAGEKLKLLTEEIIARVKATAGANYEAAPTVKKTNEVLNPVPAQDEKGLLQAREILNPSAVPTLLSKGEAVADQTVLDWAPKLTTNDLQGLYAGLARAYQNGNPAAAKPLESVRRILHDAAADKTEGGKAETFKPADYKAESVRRYISSDVSEDVRNKADLNGGALFAQTLEQMNALGLPIVKDSANEARLNRAVAHALVLQEQEGLSNTAPTLFARENLVNKWGEAATGTPDEFSKDLVLPLGKRMQELRTSTDPRTVFEATEDAVALKALGVSHNEAVDWGAKLADPAVARQIGEEAQKAGAKNADDVRRYVAEKIKNQPKPTVAERNRSLSAAFDPAPFLEQAPQRIWGGIRDAFQPPAPGAAPSYYQGR